MRKVLRFSLLLLLFCSLTLSKVSSVIVKASEILSLQFQAWYYTSDPDTMFSSSWSTDSGSYVSHLITVPNTSHVTHVYLYMSGFQPGITYNLAFTNLKIASSNNFVLRQAYIQNSNANVSLNDSFSIGSYIQDANFDVVWGVNDQRIVLYFENPNSSTTSSSVGIQADLINAIPVSYGTGTDLTNVENNTSQTASNTSGILNTIGNVYHEIIDLPSKIVHALGDFVRDLVVPDPDDLHTVIEDFKSSMSNKLGFVYQVYTLAYNFFNGLTASQSGVIRFPGISFPMGNTTYVIAQPQDVDITQNELASTLLPICKTVTSMIMVIWVVNLGLKSFLDMTSGKWG